MTTFIFNNDLANRIAAAINGTPKTAREIAKELGEDKHVINQHLYKMGGDLIMTNDKVPTWLLPESDDDDDHDDDDDDPSCEHCLCPDGDIIVHSWGCVAFCERCSDIDEQPHCPRESHSGDAEKCEYCVEGWAWIDARLPVTYKGGIIGYSKPGESGICKFSNRHH